MAVVDRVFDVLRIVIIAADDDDILNAAGDEKLARRVHESKIAGAQPGFVSFALDARPECALGGVRIAPIALANVRSVYPNLPDAIGSQPSKAVGVNNGDALTKHVPPAADNTSGIGAACRRRNP